MAIEFGERIRRIPSYPLAAGYDLDTQMSDPAVVDPVVDFLVDRVGDGSALEFGIGTGRIALPLSQRGVPVHGIDLSEAMVRCLQAKPGARRQESLFVETRRRNRRQATHVGLAERPADLLGNVKQRAHERVDRPAFVAVPNRWLEPAILQRGHSSSAPADLLLPL